jgi:hypothetical protein
MILVNELILQLGVGIIIILMCSKIKQYVIFVVSPPWQRFYFNAFLLIFTVLFFIQFIIK